MKKLDQKGSHIVAGIVALAVIAAIVLVGMRVMKKDSDQKPTDNDASQSTQQETDKQAAEDSEIIRWQFNDIEWIASATPPACKDPFVFDQSPVDVSKATSVLYPGQTRGNNYKPHGGFAFDSSANTEVAVKMPFDAYLVSGSRYMEEGELQVLLDFVSNCGIAIRFDHLKTVSPDIQAIMDKNFNAPAVDDTRANYLSEPVSFKAGDAIASEIGHTKPSLNVGMDFGVYDYRNPNEASKNAGFAAAQGQFKATTFYGVCWFDLLPAADAAKVKALPSRDSTMGKTSDYCK